MKAHPASNIFPLLEGPEFEALVQDIKKHGQQEPIYLYEGMILDGRNRLRACKQLGIEPWTEELDPKETPEPHVLAMSLNFHRRHLASMQRATVAEAYAAATGRTIVLGSPGRPSGRDKENGSTATIPVRRLARELGVDHVTLGRDLANKRDYEALPKEVQAKVDSGDVTVATAAKVVEKLAPGWPKKQREDDGEDTPRRREIRKAITERFDESAAQQKAIDSMLGWLSFAEAGFKTHRKLGLGIAWDGTYHAMISRHLDAIEGAASEWKRKLRKKP